MASRDRELKRAADRKHHVHRDAAKEQEKKYASWLRHKERYAERDKAKYDALPKSCKVYFPVCEITGRVFTARRSSVTVSDEGNRMIARQNARTIAEANHNAVIKPRNCKCCNNEFTPLYGSKKRAFCSDQCCYKYNRRVAKAMRRARIRRTARQPIDPIAIFNRDKWCCMICGVHTPQHLRGTVEDNAPELDHIIALANGGTHTIDNVQCSCRKCNNIKSNRLTMSQMVGVL